MNTAPHTVALRCAGATLLDLPHTPTAGSRVWVAAIRTATHHRDGFARQLWRPGIDGHGWTIPATCVFGTVIEFGADITTGPRRDRHPVRWYGIAVAHQPDWLICHGPHPHPTTAEHVADDWLRAARAYAVALHDPATAAIDTGRTRRPDTDPQPHARQHATR